MGLSVSGRRGELISKESAHERADIPNNIGTVCQQAVLIAVTKYLTAAS